MGYDFGFQLPSERRIFDCTCTYILPIDLDRYGVANHKSNNDKTAQWLRATAITMITMFKSRKPHTFKPQSTSSRRHATSPQQTPVFAAATGKQG